MSHYSPQHRKSCHQDACSSAPLNNCSGIKGQQYWSKSHWHQGCIYWKQTKASVRLYQLNISHKVLQSRRRKELILRDNSTLTCTSISRHAIRLSNILPTIVYIIHSFDGMRGVASSAKGRQITQDTSQLFKWKIGSVGSDRPTTRRKMHSSRKIRPQYETYTPMGSSSRISTIPCVVLRQQWPHYFRP